MPDATAPAQVLVGIDLSYAAVSASFMLSRKNAQATTLTQWPGADDPKAQTVPFIIDAPTGETSTPSWGYLATRPMSNILLALASQQEEPTAAYRTVRALAEAEPNEPWHLFERDTSTGTEAYLTVFLAGLKMHLDESIARAFGKDILSTPYDVACVLPSCMMGDEFAHSVGNVVSAVFSGSKVLMLSGSDASLGYYLSRSKKAGMGRPDDVLHIRVDQGFTSVSILAVESNYESKTHFSLRHRNTLLLLGGAGLVRTAFEEALEALLAEKLDVLNQDAKQTVGLMEGVVTAFIKFLAKFDGMKEFKMRLPWDLPDTSPLEELDGISVRKGQLLVTANFMKSALLEPFLGPLVERIELYGWLGGDSGIPDRKTHVVVTGAYSECPYILRYLNQAVEDKGLQKTVMILPVVNGQTACCRGAAIALDTERKHTTVSTSTNFRVRAIYVRQTRYVYPFSNTITAATKAARALSGFLVDTPKHDEAKILARTSRLLEMHYCRRRERVRTPPWPLLNVGVRAYSELKDSNQIESLICSVRAEVSLCDLIAGEHAPLRCSSAAVEFLVGHAGVNPNAAVTSMGTYVSFQPAHFAAEKGLVDVLRLLMELGADVKAATSLGRMTCLHIATRNACSPVGVLEGDGKGVMAVFQLVLDAFRGDRAALDAVDKQGRTAFDYAQLSVPEEKEIMRLLEEAGASGSQAQKAALKNALDIIARDDVESLNKLLDDASFRQALTRQTGNDVSLLHETIRLCTGDNPAVLKALLTSQLIGIDTLNSDGDTPLHMAIRRRNLSATSALIDFGANLEVLDQRGLAPLHVAVVEAKNEDVEILEKILMAIDVPGSPGNVHIQAAGGWTALDLAAETGSMAAASLLFRHGLHLEAQSLPTWGFRSDQQGFSRSQHNHTDGQQCGAWRPLHIAATKGHISLARFLLECGAKRSERDLEGFTALQRAAEGGFPELMLLLLEDVVPRPPPLPYTVIEPPQDAENGERAVKKKPSLLKRMLKPCKRMLLLPVRVQRQGTLPEVQLAFNAAVEAGQVEVARILLSHKADANAESPRTGLRPLSTAISKGNKQLFSLLLEHCALGAITNLDGTTALHWAAGHRDVFFFNSLAELSAAVCPDKAGLRPLMYAARSGNPQVVQSLVASERMRGWPQADVLLESIRHGNLAVAIECTRCGYLYYFHHLASAILAKDVAYISFICIADPALLNSRDPTLSLNVLHYAVDAGDIDVLNTLLALMVPGNAAALAIEQHSQRGAPFLAAIRRGDSAIVGAMLTLGVMHLEIPDATLWPHQSRLDKIALNVACQEGQVQILQMLLGAISSLTLGHISEVIFDASATISPAKAMAFLTTTVTHLDAKLPDAPPVRKELGRLLVGALNHDNEEIALFLVSHPSFGYLDVLAVMEGFMLAAKKGYAKLVAFLIKQHAVDCSHQDRRRALTVALCGNHVDAVKALLDSSRFTQLELWSVLRCVPSGTQIHGPSGRAVYEAAGCLKDGGAEALHHAIYQDDPSLLERLLDLGTSIRLPNQDGWPPLHVAVMAEAFGVAKLLLGRGVKIDDHNGERRSPLHQAVVKDSNRMVNFLLSRGANQRLPDDDGRLPVHLAVEYESSAALERLVESDASVMTVEDAAGKTPLDLAFQKRGDILRNVLRHLGGPAAAKPGEAGQLSLLHRFATEGRADDVRILLEHGADPTVVDEKKQTPLMVAVRGNHLNVMTVLLASGKNDLEAKDDDGFTALATAASLGYSALVNVLIDVGAGVHTKRLPAKWEWTPLLEMAWKDDLPLLRLLVMSGADIYAKSTLGSTALHLSAREGRVEVVKYLLECGFPVDPVKNDGQTPLAEAVVKGHANIVRILLAAGADARRRLGKGTIMHRACTVGDAEIVKLLMDYCTKAEILGTNEEVDEEQPLVLAVGNGKLEVAKMLVFMGADIRARSRLGNLPIHQAAAGGHINTLEYLLTLGPDTLEALSDFGETPLVRAARFQKADAIRFLVQKGAKYDRELENKTGGNALTYASSSASRGTKASELLLELGLDINSRTKFDNQTPLMLAIFCAKSLDMVKLYLERGADPNAEAVLTDGTKKPAIFYAVADDIDPSIFDLLVEYGANIRSLNGKYGIMQEAACNGNVAVMERIFALAPDLLESCGPLGYNPLHLACKRDHPAAAEKLLDLGANINAVAKDGFVPILAAAWYGGAELTRLLAQRGVDLNSQAEILPPRSPPKYWYPPLDCAICSDEPGRAEAMEALIAAGADINRASRCGARPVHTAAEKGNVAALNVLSKHGALLTLKTDNGSGSTALHRAASSGHVAFVRALLDRRILSVNALNNDDKTALMFAVMNGHKAVWRVLLEPRYGCNASLFDKTEWSAMHYAAQYDQAEAVKALHGRGRVDVNLVGLKGFTPLHAAVEFNAKETAKELIRLGARQDLETTGRYTPPTLAVVLDKPAKIRKFSLR